MRKLLLWTWQFPQTLLGKLIFLYYLIVLGREVKVDKYKECRIYYIRDFPSKKNLSGISLGRFIILDTDRFYNNPDRLTTIKHEYGHVRQGYVFGPLYLLAIGLPSIFQNIFSIISRKKMTNYWKDYYNRYPEKWADELGQVSEEERTKISWWLG